MGVAEERFREVELALRGKAEQLLRSGLARSVEHTPTQGRPAFPRIYVLARRGRSERGAMRSDRRMHTWLFELIVQTIGADANASYEEAVRIHWELYEAILADPSLGITSYYVDAEPAVEFEIREAQTPSGELGFEASQLVAVHVEA